MSAERSFQIQNSPRCARSRAPWRPPLPGPAPRHIRLADHFLDQPRWRAAGRCWPEAAPPAPK
eukprot:583409-Pyramimonas_sp.AAC.1